MLTFFTETMITIPLIQIILLMIMSTLSLLFGKLRLALLINYVFILNWAYILNRDLLIGLGPKNLQYISALYFLFGLCIVIVAVFSFIFQRDLD